MRLFAGSFFTLVVFAATLSAAQQNVTPASTTAAHTASQPAVAAQTSSAASTPSPQSQEPAPAAEPGAASPSLGVGSPVFPVVTKKQAEEAKKQFQAGVKLKEKGKLDEAFSKFSSASELDPTKLDYITAREFTREQLAYQALQRGNKAMQEQMRSSPWPSSGGAGIRSHQQLCAAATARCHSRRAGDGPYGQRGGTIVANRDAAGRAASRFPFSRRRPRAAHASRLGLRHQGDVRRFDPDEARLFRYPGT